MPRRTVYSATLNDSDIVLLELISRREYGGNRSAALRELIQDAGKARGLAIIDTAANAPATKSREVRHVPQAA